MSSLWEMICGSGKKSAGLGDQFRQSLQDMHDANQASRVALQALQAMQPQRASAGIASAMSSGGYTGWASSLNTYGWTGLMNTTLGAGVAPQPKAYPEAAAAIAGFAAGIKYTLNKLLGESLNDPKKEELYEEMMAAAVKTVLAPEASPELKKRGVFISQSWVSVIEMGELAPEEMSLDGVRFRRQREADEECPLPVYRQA